MNIREKQLAIQMELKAPKSRWNSFSNFHYRSLEDILEAVKPICQKHNVVLMITDDIVNAGDRYYIKATATLMDCESEDWISNSALAREAQAKKGMDDSQITGTASSYARKYALNGLFAIDDTKDAETDEDTAVRQGKNPEELKQKKTPEQVRKEQDEVARQHMINSYPTRNEMIDYILDHSSVGREKLEPLSDEKIIANYNHFVKQYGGVA